MGAGQRVAVIAFAAVVVGAVVWGLTSCNRDGDPASPATVAANGDARIVSEEELAALPAEAGHPIFWAGPLEDTETEYSIDASGNVHIRYLTDGAPAGDPDQGYLNVGTYPFAGAYEATRKLASEPDLVRVEEGGGIGFYDPNNRKSVIIAWPEYPDLQIEVYDPVDDRALDFVRRGDIVPVS
jgi:hypothetical protein